MPARQKLNAAYFSGSLLLALLVGWGCSSWTAFAVALAALLAGNLATGDIRPRRRGR